jgi:hypothetical protein
MLTFSVSSNIEKAMRQLSSVGEAKNFRFAVAKSLTKTAKAIQQETQNNLGSRFTLRREGFIKSGIRILPATKEKLESVVYSRDDFMYLQEYGGTKLSRQKYVAVPLPESPIKRTKSGIIKKTDRPKNIKPTIIGKDKKLTKVVEIKGKKFIARLKPALLRKRKTKKKTSESSKDRLDLLYILIPSAQIKNRLKLAEDGRQIAAERFTDILRQTLSDAVNSPKR